MFPQRQYKYHFVFDQSSKTDEGEFENNGKWWMTIISKNFDRSMKSNINQKTTDYINATINGTINKDLKCLCRFELINKEPIFYLYISE
jgi:hypothetical protein